MYGTEKARPRRKACTRTCKQKYSKKIARIIFSTYRVTLSSFIFCVIISSNEIVGEYTLPQ